MKKEIFMIKHQGNMMEIANAYHAASGDDLSKVQFVEANSITRNHLSGKFCSVYCYGPYNQI